MASLKQRPNERPGNYTTIFNGLVDIAFKHLHNQRLRFKKVKTICPKEALQTVCSVDNGPKTD